MKVFIPSPYSDQEEAYHQIEEAGLSLVRGRSYEQFRDQPYTEEELVVLCQDVDAILGSHRDSLTRRVLEAAEQLQLVVYPITGVDRVDLIAATELGILVCNSPSPENVIGMAEATIALMLALVKRLKQNENLLRQGRWGLGENRGDFLFGKTAGITVLSIGLEGYFLQRITLLESPFFIVGGFLALIPFHISWQTRTTGIILSAFVLLWHSNSARK